MMTHRVRKEINALFGRGDFGPGQGAKSEHTRLYVSDEQRSHGAKASGQIDAVISLRTLGSLKKSWARCLMGGGLLTGILLGSVGSSSRESEFRLPEKSVPFRLALTFDDGPHPAFTKRLTRLLREKQVKATFFIVGKQAVRYPTLLRDIAYGGHEIANHTFSHRKLTSLSNALIRRELEETRRLIKIVTRQESWFFRPPGGHYDRRVLDVTSEQGYQMVLWNVLPEDHKSPSPEEIFDRIVSRVRDGSVVLLHSGIESTVAVLPRLIDALRAKGFRFLTVSEMLQEEKRSQVVSRWISPRT